MFRFLPHRFQVAARGADVGGGEIAAAQRIHEPAPGPQQGFGLVGAGIADDDALAAAQVQARRRRLVGHGSGEVQGIGESFLFRGVGPHPGSATGRPQGSVVDGDDATQAGLGVAIHRHLLVTATNHRIQ